MNQANKTTSQRWLAKSSTRMENFDYIFSDIKTYEDFLSIKLLVSGKSLISQQENEIFSERLSE